MEKIFLDKKLTDNANQDLMGNDAHQGLERFLDKFHQPGVPSHTIITDPEYYVFLWFHDAYGRIIQCPYVSDYTPKLSQTSVKFSTANKSFADGVGIQSGTDDVKLPEKCIDLTPFVREATLPDISPAGADKIQTLFGETSAGSFSPYASDGQKSITLQVLDTEYSILDAIFYPWMKDINSPWWYKSAKAYDEATTPYPMATLEIMRPRMRYVENAKAGESRADASYKYYSYKFLGVKPTSYSPFSVNASGPSTLLRNLTMVADMCFVDLTQDAIGIASGSTNPGNRTKLFGSGGGGYGGGGNAGAGSEKSDSTAPKSQSEMQSQEAQAKNEVDGVKAAQEGNSQDMSQQKSGDMPGEDEPEMHRRTDENYNPSEYADNKSGYDAERAQGGQNPDDPSANSGGQGSDGKTPWGEGSGKANGGQSNGSADSINRNVNDGQIDKGASQNADQDKGFLGSVMDGLKSVGSGIGNAVKTATGWVANGLDAGAGLVSDVAKSAAGVASSADGQKSGEKKGFLGAAGDLAATAITATGNVVGSAAKAAGDVVKGIGTAASTALGGNGAIANQAALGQQKTTTQAQQQTQQKANPTQNMSSALASSSNRSGSTAFGVVQNVASDSGKSGVGKTTSILGGLIGNTAKSAFTLAGDIVGQAGNVIGGVGKVLTSISGQTPTNQQNQQKRGGGDDEILIPEDCIIQHQEAIGDVRRAGELAAAMNTSSSEIMDDIQYVGELAGSTTSFQSSSSSQQNEGVVELVRILNRVVRSDGVVPSPVQTYAEMATDGEYDVSQDESEDE